MQQILFFICFFVCQIGGASQYVPSEKVAAEIDLLIGPDEQARYHDLYAKICKVPSTQKECDILALQTALSYGKTGPEIAQQLRQKAIKLWKKQNEPRPVLNKAVLKMLTFGLSPDGGYAAHYFERDFLFDLPLKERIQAKQEFEKAVAAFWPVAAKQLRRVWLKRIPDFQIVDAVAFEAGLDHEATHEIYAGLLAHQYYGWITSGFAGDEFSVPSEFEALNRFENKWQYRLNDRDYRSGYPSNFNISETFSMTIAHEIVVISGLAYTEKLENVIQNIYDFSPETERTNVDVIEKLFNQDILSDVRRFTAFGLGHQFYQQVEKVAQNLGMVPIFKSEQIVGFRRAKAPEKNALIHAALLQSKQSLAAIGMFKEIPEPKGVKAEIQTLADLGNYVGVIDNTIIARKYPRKELMDLRHQLLMLSFHPKAEATNFNLNPEFRLALEKIFSQPVLNEMQSALLGDYLLRLEQMADRQIGYDTGIIAHSGYYRERFVQEMWPHLDDLEEGRRDFRSLQQLEIEVALEDKVVEENIKDKVNRVMLDYVPGLNRVN